MGDFLAKLQIKNQSNFLIIDMPGDLEEFRKEVSHRFNDKSGKAHDFIMIFAKDMKEAEDKIAKCIDLLIDDGLLWFCYPKQSSKKYKSDINRDKTWELFTKYDFRPVRQISLGDDWSALRFRNKKFVKG
jgi:hypothetical protein